MALWLGTAQALGITNEPAQELAVSERGNQAKYGFEGRVAGSSSYQINTDLSPQALKYSSSPFRWTSLCLSLSVLPL